MKGPWPPTTWAENATGEPATAGLGTGGLMVTVGATGTTVSERVVLTGVLPGLDIVNVIVNGYGAMYSYADRVAPEDRWRIAGYVRALQLSRNAPIDRLPENVRKELDASVAATTQPAATQGGARQ